MNPKYAINDESKPNVFDRRRVTLENTLNCIPMFGGRPSRDTVIGNDDILNLQIALNTTNSVSAFLKAV